MMAKINKALKAAYPDKDIEAVAGSGYIFFDGDDAFDKIPSIYCCPKSVSAAVRMTLVMDQVSEYFSSK